MNDNLLIASENLQTLPRPQPQPRPYEESIQQMEI